MQFSAFLFKIYRHGRPRLKRSMHHACPKNGFTLLELLVSSVILLTTTVGSIAAFNLLTGSIRGTGLRTEQSRVIDDDFAAIQYTSERFTSCADPAGESPAAEPVVAASYCDGGSNAWEYASSFYYFPLVADGLDETTWDDAEAFAAACVDNGNTGLRGNFIDTLNNTQPTTSDDTAAPFALEDSNGTVLAVRQPATAFGADGHLVQIEWRAPAPDNRPIRNVILAPVVSAWCP